MGRHWCVCCFEIHQFQLVSLGRSHEALVDQQVLAGNHLELVLDEAVLAIGLQRKEKPKKWQRLMRDKYFKQSISNQDSTVSSHIHTNAAALTLTSVTNLGNRSDSFLFHHMQHEYVMKSRLTAAHRNSTAACAEIRLVA